MKTPNAATLETLITNAMQTNEWATVHDLEPRLDAVWAPKTPPTLVSAALYYAEQGLKVFPLQPGRKVPHSGFKWRDEATTNQQKIISWWQRWPNANIAIATGHLVDVIDIDGPPGVISWMHMKGLPPILGTVSTPRWDDQKRQPKLPPGGGNHLYIATKGHHNAAGGRANMPPGLDVRGIGGYVCAPPSNMPNGRYTWRWPLELP